MSIFTDMIGCKGKVLMAVLDNAKVEAIVNATANTSPEGSKLMIATIDQTFAAIYAHLLDAGFVESSPKAD